MRPGRAADHSSPSSAAVMEEYSYTYTHPLGHTGPVTGRLYLYLCVYIIHTHIYNEYCIKHFNTTNVKLNTRSYIQMALKRFEIMLDVLIIPGE